MVSGVINHFLIVCSGGGRGVGLVIICNTYLFWLDYVFLNALGKTFITFILPLNYNMVFDHFFIPNFFYIW